MVIVMLHVEYCRIVQTTDVYQQYERDVIHISYSENEILTWLGLILIKITKNNKKRLKISQLLLFKMAAKEATLMYPSDSGCIFQELLEKQHIAIPTQQKQFKFPSCITFVFSKLSLNLLIYSLLLLLFCT